MTNAATTAIRYGIAGTVIALATVGLVWYLVSRGDGEGWRWQVIGIIVLGAELVFLLFLPGNKGGQQFGPRDSWYGPMVSAGAEFYDEHPSRRSGDIRWLWVGLPILVATVVLIVSL